MHELTSAHNINGKGDNERSFKWRDNYDEINWSNIPGRSSGGFARIAYNRVRKTYGARACQRQQVDHEAIGAGVTTVPSSGVPAVPPEEQCAAIRCVQRHAGWH
jgi:hypothetical protein